VILQVGTHPISEDRKFASEWGKFHHRGMLDVRVYVNTSMREHIQFRSIDVIL